MTIRYFDPWSRGTHLTYTVSRVLESFESPFQKIEVLDTHEWGRVLCLDGVTNVTERDESVYHEMLAHPPMLAHPEPRRVLIIGGGDGGTLGEVLRHPSVEEAVLVDIDAEVMRVSRAWFPTLAASLDHEKANVIVGDGLAYVAKAAAAGERFDVILIDSTDPVEMAAPLFQAPFYRQCAQLLGEGGVLVPQSDSPIFHVDRVVKVVSTLREIFGIARPYLAPVTAYPGGMWAFTAASRTLDVASGPHDAARASAIGETSRFFQPALMQAATVLPAYLERRLAGAARGDRPAVCDAPGTTNDRA